MTQTRLTGFQIFSLCVMASAMGLFAVQPGGFSPGYPIAVVALFLIQAGTSVLLNYAFRRANSNDFFSLMSTQLSAPLSRLVLLLLAVLLTLRASVTLSVQTDAVGLYLLEDTSGFAVMLILLLTAFFALMPGIRRLSGSAVLFTLILPIPILIILIPGLLSIEPGRLRVLYQVTPGEIMSSFVPAAITASGTQCALFFLGNSGSGKRVGKGVVIAPAVCAAVFAAFICLTVGTIGLSGLTSEAFPFIEASRQINSGGIELTERFDLPLIAAVLAASIIQLTIFTLCAAHSLGAVFDSDRTGTFALGLLPAEFAAAMLIQNTGMGELISTICAWGLTGCTLLLFPLLWLLALIRFRKVNYNE